MGLFNWGKAIEESGAGVKSAFTGIGSGVGEIINSAKGQIPPEYQGQIEKLKTEVDGQLKQAEIETGIKVKQLMAEAQNALYDFSLKYEGTADQVPKWILMLRTLIRPLITIAMTFSFIFFMGADIFNKGVEGYEPYLTNLPTEYWWMLGIVLTFWFGGKAGENIVSKLNIKQ